MLKRCGTIIGVWAAVLLGIVTELGCGYHPYPVPKVQPATATLQAGAAQQFSVGPLVGGTVWYVNGIAGGNSQVGTITGSGLYQAPAVALPFPVTVTARAIRVPVQAASAVVNLVNPAPVISSLNPGTIAATGQPIEVVIQGSGFIQQSQVVAGETACPTTLISASEIHAAIPASLAQPGGVVPVAVVTSAPGGGATQAFSLHVLPDSTVAATSHPLVASYTWTLPAGASMSVDFGPDPTYGRSTWTQPAPAAGGDTRIYVAGMKASSIYHLRARVTLSDGSVLQDVDHEFTTGPLPNISFPHVSVTSTPGTTNGGGVNLVSSMGTKASAVALDMDGSVIWYYYDRNLPGQNAFPITQLPNGNFLVNLNYMVEEVDLAGNIVRSISIDALNAALAAAGYDFVTGYAHHDLLELANHHWILLVNDARNFQDVDGFPGTSYVASDAIVDLDENNNVVWLWRAFDHLDVNRHPMWFPDWTHSNSLVYMPDGNLLLSMRDQSWVIKIDYADGHGTGDVLWRLGPDGDFSLAGGDPAQWFYNQHHPMLLDSKNGHLRISIYDDGDARPYNGGICLDFTACYTRAVIYDVDESARTASVEWQYAADWFASWGGSVSVLSPGDVVFTSSTVAQNDAETAAGTMSNIVEVAGETPRIVWEMQVKNAYLYRGVRIPSLYPGVHW